VVDLFVLALEKAAAGSFFFAESGEASMKSIAEQISRALGFGGRTQSWPLEDAVREWGSGMARFGLGSNCRVRGVRARQALGWQPSEQSLENYLKTISGSPH
jgi:nucleoside-diphosphate-sugar epimerase